MHYGWDAFAQDSSKPTLTDKNGNKVGPSDDFTLVKYFFFLHNIPIFSPIIYVSIIGNSNRLILWI